METTVLHTIEGDADRLLLEVRNALDKGGGIVQVDAHCGDGSGRLIRPLLPVKELRTPDGWMRAFRCKQILSSSEIYATIMIPAHGGRAILAVQYSTAT